MLVAFLPALLFGGSLLRGQWRSEREDLVSRMDANARLTANAIDDFLDGQLAGVELLADPVLTVGDNDGADLEGLLRVYPAMLGAMLVDGQGRAIAVRDTRGRLVPLDTVAADAWFRVARNTDTPFISGVYRGHIHTKDIVVAAVAPLVRNGRFDGAIQATIPVASFARVSADSLHRRNLELLLLDQSNHVVYAGPDVRWSLLQDTGDVGRSVREAALPASETGRVRMLGGVLAGDGRAYVNAVRMRNGWVAAVVAPSDTLSGEFLPRFGLLLGLLVLTALGVWLALWRQKQLLQQSIGYLVASLRGFAIGGTLHPANRSRVPDEMLPLANGIGELATRMNAAFVDLRQVLDQREHDIAERTDSLRQAVSELDRLSRTDALTGSLNYRGFLETSETLWREARESGKPLAVLALDIDHFKRYNDHYGHAAGDGALRRFAGAVRSALLHVDDVLARPGGEEFLVFLPGSTFEQAMQVGERVCQRVRDADIVHADSPEGRITVSIGVANMAADDREAEDMLRRADGAMYRAKHAGRNRVSD